MMRSRPALPQIKPAGYSPTRPSCMAGASTPYPRSRTGRWPGITGHKNVPETQENQGPRPLQGLAPGAGGWREGQW